MSEHGTYISRARVIQGILATGALAACGGGGGSSEPAPLPTPTPLAGLCRPLASTSADRYGLSAVLAKPEFRHLDQQWLLDTFDSAPHLEALSRNYLSTACGQIQTGSTISSIPSAGICITSPGSYTLGGNITWTPSATATAAITIQASNVTLDLAGYTLAASIADKSMQLSAINLVGPLDNITIANGTLASFTEHGIMANQVCGLAISKVAVTGLCMQNLNVRSLTPSGMLVMNGQDVTIAQCSVTGTNVTTDASAAFQLISTTLSTVNDCYASSLVNNDGAVQGFSYVGCSYVTTTNCNVNTAQTFFHNNVLTTGHTAIGFLPTFCNNLTFTACSSTDITGCCDDAHGMSVFLSWLVTVQGFTATRILDGSNDLATHPASGAKATGLEIYSFGGVTANDCVANYVRAINPEDLQAAGFSAWGSAIGFQRCSASNVSVQNDNNVADMRGLGFGWAPDPRPAFATTTASLVTYLDCQATNCDVGFDTWDHVNSTWTGTTHTNCTIGYLAEPLLTVRIVSCDPCSECLTPIPNQKLYNAAIGNTYPST